MGTKATVPVNFSPLNFVFRPNRLSSGRADRRILKVGQALCAGHSCVEVRGPSDMENRESFGIPSRIRHTAPPHRHSEIEILRKLGRSIFRSCDEGWKAGRPGRSKCLKAASSRCLETDRLRKGVVELTVVGSGSDYGFWPKGLVGNISASSAAPNSAAGAAITMSQMHRCNRRNFRSNHRRCHFLRCF
jgi:hypothetical protein